MTATQRSSIRLLLLLSLGHLIVDMHAGGPPIMLPLLKEAYDLTYAQIGALVLLSHMTSSVIQPAFGFFSDRISTRWILPVSLILATVGIAVVGLSTSFAGIVAGVVVMGAGIAAYHPEGSKVAHYVGGNRKGRSMSIFAIGGNVGIALGPLLMALGIALAGLPGALLFLPVTAVAVVLFQRHTAALYSGWDTEHATPTHAAPDLPPPPKHSPMRALKARGRDMTLLLSVITLRSFAHTALITFIPLYYSDLHGNSAAYSSLMLTLFLLAGAAGTVLGGPASDRFGPRSVIITSFIASTPALAALPFVTAGWTPFVFAAFGGFALVSSFAVTTVLGQQLLPRHVGLASGLTLGFSVGTGGIGVALLGLVADRLGLAAALVSVSVLLLAGALVALLLPKTEREPIVRPLQSIAK